MEWTFDDGGRADAGFVGTAGDCVCRAISIAAQLDYKEVYKKINSYAKDERMTKRQGSRSSAREGVRKNTSKRILRDLGWKWHPTMTIGSGCSVHMRAEELPKGRIICKLSHHLVAVIDGVIHDTYDCSREGTRCVYGYWTAE